MSLNSIMKKDNRGVTSLEYGSIILLIAGALAIPMALAASHLWGGVGTLSTNTPSGPYNYPDGEVNGGQQTSIIPGGNGTAIVSSPYARNGYLYQSIASQYPRTFGALAGQLTSTIEVPFNDGVITAYKVPETGMNIYYGGTLPGETFPAAPIIPICLNGCPSRFR